MTRSMWRAATSAESMMTWMMTWVIGALVSTALNPPAVQAQEPDSVSRHQVGCFRGEPLPACRSFWLVEMQAHTPLAQTTRRVSYGGGGPPVPVEAFESVLEWNVGHMVNLNASWAVGGVLTAGTGKRDPVVGLKVRGRRWMSPDWSVEL